MPIIIDPLDTTARTFLELQNEALGDDFEPSKYRAMAKRTLNEAQRRIARRVKVPLLEAVQEIATVPGVAEYELDEAVVRLNSLRQPSLAEPLTGVAIEEFDDWPTGSGRPNFYALVGRQLVLAPTPNGQYLLAARYQARPTELVEDSDRPEIGDDYADLLVTYARGRLFRAEDDFEASSYYMGEFTTGVLEYAGDVQRADRSRVRRIPGMFVGGGGLHFRRPGE